MNTYTFTPNTLSVYAMNFAIHQWDLGKKNYEYLLVSYHINSSKMLKRY